MELLLLTHVESTHQTVQLEKAREKSREVGQMATRKATTGSAISVYLQNIQEVEQNMKLESE